MEQDIVSAGYDAVYGATPKSRTLRWLWHELAEGLDFPDEFGHISFTTLPELQRVAAELRLRPGDTLVDLGCGMAGPALWVARETKARLIGVDLSPVAVGQAGARAAQLGLTEQARFIAGSFAETGLETDSADGVMSEDAIQYAPDKQAAITEAARILRPGGRLVFTVFELDPERAAGLPVLGDDPVHDYRPLLTKSGFSVEVYEEVPGWPEPMTTTYSTLVNARESLTQEMGEQAVAALLMELSMTLQQQPYRRRVLAAATRNPA
jgi:ubiquinone/menaquinone biosynthesis C-methylase UbiE